MQSMHKIQAGNVASQFDIHSYRCTLMELGLQLLLVLFRFRSLELFKFLLPEFTLSFA